VLVLGFWAKAKHSNESARHNTLAFSLETVLALVAPSSTRSIGTSSTSVTTVREIAAGLFH
jgi:hypothetical protein